MRIFMIASLYKPFTLGGAEVAFQMIVDELKKSHEVIIVSARPWRGFRSLVPDMSQEEGVRVYRFFPLNIFSFLTCLKKPAFLRALWHILDALNIHSYYVLCSLLRKERPDIVLTHNLKGIGLTIPRAIALRGIFHVHTVHDIQLLYPSGIVLYGKERSFRNRFSLFIPSVVARWLFRSPSVVIFPSCFLRDLYAHYSFFTHSQYYVIQNPSHHLPITESIIGNNGREDGGLSFAFVGQLEMHKGIEFLLCGWSQWKRDHVQLFIAGKGTKEPIVREMVERDSRIHFFGYQKDVMSFLADVTFVIVPSMCYENAPMIILESLRAGIPIIASRIGGIPEYIEDGVNGFLFSPGDIQSLIGALERARAARDHYAHLSRNARETMNTMTPEQYCSTLLHATDL